MKLFAKYSRINLIATLVIFLVASIAFYFTLRLVFINQIDEDLKIEEKEIETYVKEHNQLPESISVTDQLISYSPVQDKVTRTFRMKMIREEGEAEAEKFRQLIFGVEAGGKRYEATVSKSMEETETLTKSILLIAFTTILVILLVAFIINRVVLKRIWRPFYQSLDTVKGFRLGSKQALSLSSTNIDEFHLMNETLEKITNSAQLDYLALKTFSENASHEIQTPLAVIRSKLDLMMQEEGLTEKQSESLQAAHNSVQKLTKLNQSLLLLARIENKQFHEKNRMALKSCVEDKISDFQELWISQELHIQARLEEATVHMNEELMDILLNNLLSNATRHNYQGGQIQIALDQNRLIVSNTSHDPALQKDTLYRRFSRQSQGNGSNGLGLSIIKQICDSSGFNIHYEFKEGLHQFMIQWK